MHIGTAEVITVNVLIEAKSEEKEFFLNGVGGKKQQFSQRKKKKKTENFFFERLLGGWYLYQDIFAYVGWHLSLANSALV